MIDKEILYWIVILYLICLKMNILMICLYESILKKLFVKVVIEKEDWLV